MQSHYPDVKVIQTGQGAQSSVWLSPAGKPVESPSALRHVDELMSSRSGPKGLQVERPVAPLGSADSLRELLDLVHRFINSITNLFRLRLSDST